VGRSEDPEYFQDVSQFRGQLPVRCCLRLLGLLKQLCPQGSLVTGVVQDAGNRLTSVCRDDAGDLVADELAVGDAPDLDSTVRLTAANGNVLPFQDAARAPRGTGGSSSGSAGTCQLQVRSGPVLLELGRRQTFVPLQDLAVPYAAGICEHLQVEDRQSTSAKSQFLDACRSRNRGELDAAQLAEATVRLGFANVIDAFHVRRGGQPTQTRFFVDGGPTARASR
jgi:hypothetical protein